MKEYVFRRYWKFLSVNPGECFVLKNLLKKLLFCFYAQLNEKMFTNTMPSRV